MRAKAGYEQLKKNEPVIAKLRAARAKGPKLAKEGGTPLNVVVTGSVKGSPLGSLSRSGVQELIEANGGKASGSVSKSTDLLVCGEEGSSKWLKAKEMGIRIVTPDEFAKMLEDGEA